MIKKLAALAALSLACLCPASRLQGQIETSQNPLRHGATHGPVVFQKPQTASQDQRSPVNQASGEASHVPEDVWNAMFPARAVSFEQPSPDVATMPAPSLDLPEQLDANPPTLADLLAASNRQVNSTGESNGPDARSESITNTIGAGMPIGDGLGPLLQRIATGTALVLVVGIAFILIAKPWFSGRPSGRIGKSGHGKSLEKPSIQLLANFKINAKSTLHLVEAGDQQVLIASDVTGIRSVVPLVPSAASSFEDSLLEADAESTENNPPTEEDAPTRYGPGQLSGWAKRFERGDGRLGKQNEQRLRTEAEIESEMRRQLAALLGEQAFDKGRFRDSRSVA